MTKQINKNILFNIFGVNDFFSLEEAINNMAPSIVEYHLSNLDNEDTNVYLNKKDIERSLYFGDYSIYQDYNENLFVEVEAKEDLTTSFW
ncbi:hypothetical protein CPU12_06555 [Malaciobacter molluscorum LMG 25693]|uniref:Uncharacterized protein n=1 Tax=Malaciobacter molluscorum LMG 25693 TaxID=870501 RepID=A0A2G1DIF2_9BACT|nr:hypothetical protein [Malaciobacter molluscorum]AXX92428.1 hypothetical protein AMOL_1458 [Malaciobacter molluscorum LMG 25693]PHO18126.1 hypothetical protein CPU12_06555 [Malaciobacter molluscorum LMG 25693]